MENRGWLLFLIPIAAVIVVAVVLEPPDPQDPGVSQPKVNREPEPFAEVPDHPAFRPSRHSAPIPDPGPTDWLSVHPEAPQSFGSFARHRSVGNPATPTAIVLVPMCTEGVWVGSELESLRRFTESYFVVPTVTAAVVKMDQKEFGHRYLDGNGGAVLQFLTSDLLDLLRDRRADSGSYVVGMVTEDLYPGDEWNFVFGQASLRDRVAVYSFARFDPQFWGESVAGERDIVLHRSLKVLAHETAHMFGIRHCTEYHCIMNGSNHLDESDAAPFHLCPIDLAKLHHVVGFDPNQRYRVLAEVYRNLGMNEQVEWVTQRLEGM